MILRSGIRGVALAVSFALLALAQTAGAAPQRVISLSPNLTQAIYAIGAGDRVVGVDDFTIGPAAALKLPRLGGWANPNFERITALKPDLLIVLGRHETVTDFGKRSGIAVLQVPMLNLATIRSGVADIGKALGCEDAATSWTKKFDARIAEYKSDLAANPEQPRPRVFISMTRQAGSLASLFTVGGGTFLDEALELAGGLNVYRDVKQPFPEVSAETLIDRKPDVILELEAGKKMNDEQRAGLIADWKPFAQVPAVRRGRVRVLTDDDLLIAGPNFPELVERLRNAINEDVATTTTGKAQVR